MSKKFNNRNLLIVLAALVLIFVLVKWYQKQYTDNTLNANIVAIDTSKVTRLELYPNAEKGSQVSFAKVGNAWSLSNGKVTAEPEQHTVENLLSVLSEIKVQRLASRDKKKWDEYKVSDTTATRVKVFEQGKLILDLYVGKFNYQRSNNINGGMNGGVSGTSFIRVASEDEIYAVDGFLTFSFNQQFGSFRKQTIARFEPSKITQLTFKYPADSSFVLELKDKKWMVGNKPADSAKVASYLSSLSYKSATTFDDQFKPMGAAPAFQLSVVSNDAKTITIEAFERSNTDFIIHSDMNPKSWFASNNSSLLHDIFVGNASFNPDKKKKKK